MAAASRGGSPGGSLAHHVQHDAGKGTEKQARQAEGVQRTYVSSSQTNGPKLGPGRCSD